MYVNEAKNELRRARISTVVLIFSTLRLTHGLLYTFYCFIMFHEVANAVCRYQIFMV